jgi:glycosyltransferase involved in cell wall biosynthesis
MRIAFIFDCIYPYVKGGVEKRNWEIAKRLASRGHEVHIYGVKDWEGDSSLLNEGVYIHGLGVNSERLKESGRRSILQSIRFSIQVMSALFKEKKKYDIIDCASSPYFSAFPCRAYCSLKGVFLVVTWHEVWDIYWYQYLGKVKGFFGRSVERSVSRLPDRIISVSESTRRKLIDLGARPDVITTIPNGVDLSEASKVKPSEQKADILFAGRLAKDKNADILLKSIKLVQAEMPDINCCIVGEGPEEQRLKELSKELAISKNVRFLGYMKAHEEVIALIKSAKVYAMPSTREGFGIIYLEAMACGVPVIGVYSKDSECVSELITDGMNGFLLKELDERVLADRILLLLKDEKMRYEMGLKGKEIAQAYSWDKLAERTEKLYTEVREA